MLLVRVDAFGDFILWLPAAAEIRRMYPASQWEITLVGNQAWCRLAAKMRLFDHIWGINYASCVLNLSKRLQLMAKIRRFGFDVMLSTAWSRDFLLTDAIARNCGAVERIGCWGDMARVSAAQATWGRHWYSRLLGGPSPLLHELDRHQQILKMLGGADTELELATLPILARIDESLVEPAYAVVSPGAGKGMRRWSTENFAAIAKNLWESQGWRTLVIGVDNEAPLADEICRKTSTPITNLCGLTTPEQMIEIIRGAQIVVCNETSSSQLSAALKVPMVCIVGGGHFGRFVPFPERIQNNLAPTRCTFVKMACYNCDWHCCYNLKNASAFPCISSVSIEQTWAACLEVIKEKYSQKYI